MVVHHVVVNPVGASGNDVAHFFAQAGKIGGQEGGGNAVGGHERIVAFCGQVLAPCCIGLAWYFKMRFGQSLRLCLGLWASLI